MRLVRSTPRQFAFDERGTLAFGIVREREQLASNRAGNGEKSKPCAATQFDFSQWFHKSSFVGDRDHRGHAPETRAEEGSRIACDRNARGGVLALAGLCRPRRYSIKPGRMVRPKLGDTWTSCIELQFV